MPWLRAVGEATADAAVDLCGVRDAFPRPVLAPTPQDVVHADGTARLLRFRRPEGAPPAPPLPLLLVPSMINRWYVLDLRAGASLAGALSAEGLDVFCLDWGIPRDEDRDLTWEDVLARLRRATRRVRRLTGAPRVGLLGYCMGATLSGIHTALHPDEVALLVNLAGPFDFSRGGALSRMVDARWFDPDAITAAGNVSPGQMESGFTALGPTAPLAKWAAMPDLLSDRRRLEGFLALETWARDNIPFPASAYRTYIRELYQENALVRGTHRVGGRPVDLSRIACPLLSVAATRDVICPLDAVVSLESRVSTDDVDRLVVPGGHVGAVVGSRASRLLYPGITRWVRPRLFPKA